MWEDEAPRAPGDVAREGVRDGDTFRDTDRVGDVSNDGEAFGGRDGEALGVGDGEAFGGRDGEALGVGDGDAFGDRVGYRGGVGRGAGGPQTPKAKMALVLVVTLVVLASVVLCCMAIDQAARLIDVDPTRL